MSVEEGERFEQSNICWICSKLIDLSEEKVRDHCHISEKYRAAAHWSCNSNLKISKKFPVIFHNLKGSDSHLIFKKLSRFNNLKISVIPNGFEKYMIFTINKNLVFSDSMQFVNSSLGLLVKNLMSRDFKYFSKEFSGEYLRLVKEKGIYPHKYMNSFKKFSENKLPDKSNFFSSLKDSGINKEQYDRAVNVWKIFKIKNFGEYHNLYLKTDVLLLVDVFEKFIKTCLDYYSLDPCHYFRAPGLSFDAMLKMTGVKLQTISDINVYLFIEKGMRGGISNICKRYALANNKYLKNYHSNKENTFIIYWDANNLYGWGMDQPFPYSDFSFLTEKEINEFCLDCISENSPIGYILEVDLEYCKELHESHSVHPLAPEKVEINSNMLSKYCCDIAIKYGIRCESKPNFISQKIFSKSFTAVHQIKSVLTLNKPVYVRFCILELSKLLMYQFHFKYVKNKFDAKLLFTDTDSLVYEIKSEDVYEECFKDIKLFDFSEYPVDLKFYDSTNKQVLGKMKDEFKGQIITEFISLKSKMHSLTSIDNKEISKAKGVSKKIRHNEHVGCLFNEKVVRHNMKSIQSILHETGTF